MHLAPPGCGLHTGETLGQVRGGLWWPGPLLVEGNFCKVPRTLTQRFQGHGGRARVLLAAAHTRVSRSARASSRSVCFCVKPLVPCILWAHRHRTWHGFPVRHPQPLCPGHCTAQRQAGATGRNHVKTRTDKHGTRRLWKGRLRPEAWRRPQPTPTPRRGRGATATQTSLPVRAGRLRWDRVTDARLQIHLGK